MCAVMPAPPEWWHLAAAAPALLNPEPSKALEEVAAVLEPYKARPTLPPHARPLPRASKSLYTRSLKLLESYTARPRGGEREGGIAAFMAAAEALEERSPGLSTRLSLEMARLSGTPRGAGSVELWSHVAARSAASGGRPGGVEASRALEALVELAVEAALILGPWSLVSPPPAPSVNPAAARLLALATDSAPEPLPPAPWEAFHVILPDPGKALELQWLEPYWRPPPMPRGRGAGRASSLPVCTNCGSAPGLIDGLCPACSEALRLGGQGIVAAAMQLPPRPPGLPGDCSLGSCPWDPPGAGGRAARILESLGLRVSAASGSGAVASARSVVEAYRAAVAAAGKGLVAIAGEPWLIEASTAPGAPAALLTLGPRCASPPCASRDACRRFCSGMVIVARRGILGAFPVRPPLSGMGSPPEAVGLLAGEISGEELARLGDAAAQGGMHALTASPQGRRAAALLREAGLDPGEASRLGIAVWLRGRSCPRGWRPLASCPGYCLTLYPAGLLYVAAAVAEGLNDE